MTDRDEYCAEPARLIAGAAALSDSVQERASQLDPAPSARHAHYEYGHTVESGFTLVELLVAMVIGLFLILGVGSIFLVNQRTYRTSGALADVADSSRIAFELMARDIRAAGSTGCDDTAVSVGLSSSPKAWWNDWSNPTYGPLHGYGGSTSDPAAATGNGEGARVAGTDSIAIIRAGDAQQAAGAGRAVIECSPSGTNVTTIVDQKTSIDGVNPIPTWPVLAAFDWYIGNNPVNGQSLYRVALIPDAAGGMTTQIQEMVRNVTDMKITYLQPPNVAYVDASAVTDWTLVTATHVTLTIESASTQASVNTGQPIIRTYEATTTVRGRVNPLEIS